MLSLLALSLALSAPATAAPVSSTAVLQMGVDSNPLVQMQFDTPISIEQQSAGKFDDMEIHPNSDICYKIRAFIFSQGRNPRLLRETTCGPKAAASQQTDGNKLVPLDGKAKPGRAPQE